MHSMAKQMIHILFSIDFRTFALIPSKSLPKLGEIMHILCENGLSITNCAMYQLTCQQSNNFVTLLNFGISDDFSAGPLVALVLTGCNSFYRLKLLATGNQSGIFSFRKSCYSQLCYMAVKLSDCYL